MIDKRKVIGFIPIRKGSKSIPNKNLKEFCGKPLVYWMAKAMSESEHIDRVFIAHDYDKLPDEVLSLKNVVDWKRSDESARDEASSEEVLLEFLNDKKIGIDDDTIVVFGQATSPLTQVHDVNNGIKIFSLLNGSDVDTVVSAVRCKRYFWDIKSNTPVNYDYMNRKRRQDFEGCYMENGALYINTKGNINSNNCRIGKFPQIFEMPYYTSFEIDEVADWVVVEELAKKLGVIKQEVTKLPVVDDTIPKLFITDVDGTLTDGGMYYGVTDKDEEIVMKKFNTKDGFAVHKLREAGCKVAIITSEKDPQDNLTVKMRAQKLQYDYCCFCNGRSKVEVAKEICEQLGITFADCGMVGDSENDYEMLSLVGDAFCPADAHPRVKALENITVMKRKGGEGVLREITDEIYGL